VDLGCAIDTRAIALRKDAEEEEEEEAEEVVKHPEKVFTVESRLILVN
jgi:hypothetical protein